MSSPKVSVVMSVFNGQTYVTEAIESILGQTFREYEFVIIDDGSKDKTPEILARYASRDERIRLHRHANKGMVASLNIGIGLAKGEYIARMDSDDIALPHRFQEQVRFMDSHPEVGLLGGAIEMIDGDGRAIGVMSYPLKDSEIRSAMSGSNPFAHPTAVMRKEIVLALGGYRSPFEPSEDYDLWLRMSERTRLANLDAVLVRYRLHANQESVGKLERQILGVMAARAAAERRRSGEADPFTGASEITRETANCLGLTPEKMQTALAEAYAGRISLLKNAEPESALVMVERLNELSRKIPVEPKVLASAWMAAAHIRYKQKKPAAALTLAGRALLMPGVAIGGVRGFMRERLWHPLLNFTRPIRHTLGLRRGDEGGNEAKNNPGTENGRIYREWVDRDFAAPSPHFVKHKVLLRNGLREATWVETGTYLGDTTEVLSKVARLVYSIEPEPALFAKAQRRFGDVDNVKIIHGVSEKVLPKLVPTLSGNVCFWLDGHYSDGITFKGSQDTPIVDELSAIEGHLANIDELVVMIDDVRCFDPTIAEYAAYPSVDFLVDWCRKLNLNWHIEQDIFVARSRKNGNFTG